MWAAIAITAPVLVIVNAVYFVRRLNRSLEDIFAISERKRAWFARIYLAVSASFPVAMLLYVLYRWLGPAAASRPEGPILDYLLIYPFWFTTCYSFQCTVLFGPLDLAAAVARRLRQDRPWQRYKHLAMVGIAAGFALYMPARMVYDMSALDVRQHRLETGVPAELHGFRIAFVSDMQADRYSAGDRLDALVAAVNESKPDLVLIGGDMITSGSNWIEVAGDYAGQLQARHGVFSCVGDHDHFAYGRDRARSLAAVQKALADRGVQMIDDGVARIEVAGRSVGIALVSSHYMRRFDPGVADRVIAETADDDLRIAVAHQANEALIDIAQRREVALLLAGHTHGGQVSLALPFFSLNAAVVETPYLTGAFEFGDLTMIVSSGLGYSVAPLRYRVPATVDIVDLGPQKH